MLPGVDGFKWTAGNLIFLGGFFTVAGVIATTMMFVLVRVIRDFRSHRDEGIRWHADFEDLPERARACRHELTNEVSHRTCENGFECGKCKIHPLFLQARQSAAPALARESAADIFGLEMPAGRMYHRGHTWVQPETDGTLRIGLDDFGARLVGTPEVMELPEAGTRLHANGTACVVRKGGATARILSPIDGEVVEAGGTRAGWLLRMKPVEQTDTRHLLQGDEIGPWILREIERLQFALSSEGVGLSLADGGEMVTDIPSACPAANWHEVWSELFLEP
jgi:hypothetical protein